MVAKLDALPAEDVVLYADESDIHINPESGAAPNG
jgi:hypothetical protein